MVGHHGQPIPKLVGRLLHLLGHSTESRFLAISSLCLYNWEYNLQLHNLSRAWGLYQEATNRGQNKVFKMGGHDGQPIPKLVSHLLHLLEHATESRFLALTPQSMLVQLGVQLVKSRKPQTRSISLITGTRGLLAQQLHFDLSCLATEKSNKQQERLQRSSFARFLI